MKRATKLTTGLLLIALTLVSGCAATGLSEGCAGWKPIRLAPSTIDALTDQDAREILAHNTFGRSQNCW
jgi:hypothetical protein